MREDAQNPERSNTEPLGHTQYSNIRSLNTLKHRTLPNFKPLKRFPTSLILLLIITAPIWLRRLDVRRGSNCQPLAL